MLIDFFLHLRSARLPVSVKEYLLLLEAMSKGVIGASVDDFYLPLIEHPRVVRVVALSGGYPRDVANELLSRNRGMIASFSRALTEGLAVEMSDSEFDAALSEAIDGIYAASLT